MNESTKLLYTTFYTFITCIPVLLFANYPYLIEMWRENVDTLHTVLAGIHIEVIEGLEHVGIDRLRGRKTVKDLG